MKTIMMCLTVIGLLFSSSGSCAMTISGTFESTDSSAFMDMVVEAPGKLIGLRSGFFKLTVKGIANLDHCTMKKDVFSYGILNAIGTKFLKDLTIYSGETSLNACNLQNLYIADQTLETIPTVYLYDATVINGSIIFATGEGKVYKGPEVVISGSVIGGTLLDLEDNL